MSWNKFDYTFYFIRLFTLFRTALIRIRTAGLQLVVIPSAVLNDEVFAAEGTDQNQNNVEETKTYQQRHRSCHWHGEVATDCAHVQEWGEDKSCRDLCQFKLGTCRQ